MSSIVVRARPMAIPAGLRRGDYAHDPRHRQEFQRWLQRVWEEKDHRMDDVIRALRAAARGPRTAPELE